MAVPPVSFSAQSLANVSDSHSLWISFPQLTMCPKLISANTVNAWEPPLLLQWLWVPSCQESRACFVLCSLEGCRLLLATFFSVHSRDISVTMRISWVRHWKAAWLYVHFETHDLVYFSLVFNSLWRKIMHEEILFCLIFAVGWQLMSWWERFN